jgi:alpha-galactosidase
MRLPEVKEYLESRVIDFLEENGFDYMKIDYNDTVGIGCDGSESLGEGLRANFAASQGFYRRIRERLPNLIIETCASGGHRLEPSMLELGSLASCSDAHECVENPIIAAALHRLVLPRLSLVWVVLRSEFSHARTLFALGSGFLGRLCLSGDITGLHDWQNDLLNKTLALYSRTKHIIKNGKSTLYSRLGPSWRRPSGWQCMLRVSGDESEALAVFHSFEGKFKAEVCAEIGGEYEIAGQLVSDSSAYMRGSELCMEGMDEFDSAIIWLKRKNR